MKQIFRKARERLYSPLLTRFNVLNAEMRNIEREIEFNRLATAQLLTHIVQSQTLSDLTHAEFKVFSQWGEDGIIQYLLSKVPIENDQFVEFGVEDYVESNTRFLLVNNNWRGLVIDSEPRNIESIYAQDYYWRHELIAISAHITAENINSILSSQGISGDIGLLSIDLDGNDYWVWKAIDVVQPRLVIVEYNSLFGNERAITVPYRSDFARTSAHYSNLYFGASLAALCNLAREKGYTFVGSNSVGVNAFFVRSDVAAGVTAIECKQGYVRSRVREARTDDGRPYFATSDERINLIADMKVVDLESGAMITLREALRVGKST